jgi:hypothetical protein
MLCAHAAPACFPAFSQPSVSPDSWEQSWGRSGLEEVRSILPKLDRSQQRLGDSCWNPESSARSMGLPKPSEGQLTCTSAAHSQQVALEECLLATELTASGTLASFDQLTRSWACELVHTVAATAINVLDPAILVHEPSRTTILAVLNAGRCIWGWPLEVWSSAERLLTWRHPVARLIPIVLTSPYPGVSTVSTTKLSSGSVGDSQNHIKNSSSTRPSVPGLHSGSQ